MGVCLGKKHENIPGRRKVVHKKKRFSINDVYVEYVPEDYFDPISFKKNRFLNNNNLWRKKSTLL
jgi:hypothetical protein